MRDVLSFWRSLRRLFDAVGKPSKSIWGAQERSFRLLVDNLSATQRQQFARHRYFDVIGGDTGKTYRIREGYFLNVDRLDQTGISTLVLCFGPEGHLPMGDILLAQKLALELVEANTLQVANALPPNRRPCRGSVLSPARRSGPPGPGRVAQDRRAAG